MQGPCEPPSTSSSDIRCPFPSLYRDPSAVPCNPTLTLPSLRLSRSFCGWDRTQIPNCSWCKGEDLGERERDQSEAAKCHLSGTVLGRWMGSAGGLLGEVEREQDVWQGEDQRRRMPWWHSRAELCGRIFPPLFYSPSSAALFDWNIKAHSSSRFRALNSHFFLAPTQAGCPPLCWQDSAETFPWCPIPRILALSRRVRGFQFV